MDFPSAPDTEFVGAAPLLSRDSNKDEVYFFYNDINRTAGLDDKVYKAYLGRVCKVGNRPGPGKPLSAGFSPNIRSDL